MANDEQYTPKALFDAMGVEFDLDVAAPIDGIPWIPAKAHYSIVDNALEKPWWGIVWMNPPYSKPSPWVDKFIAHGNGIALLPMAKSKWCYDLWQSCTSITFIGTMKFHQMNGTVSQIFMPVALWGMGDKADEGIEKAKLGRVR